MGVGTYLSKQNYSGGVATASAYMGYNPSKNYILRIAFTVPADGACHIAFEVGGIYNATMQSLTYMSYCIGTDPNSHTDANAATGSENMGRLSMSYVSGPYFKGTGEADINLPAGATAYIWLFPNQHATKLMWNTSHIDAQSVTITTTAGSSAIGSITSPVTTGATLTMIAAKTTASNWHKAKFKSGETLLAESDAFSDSVSFTVPHTWMANAPNSTSLTVTAELYTYTDSGCTTQVGAAVTQDITVNAAADIKPELGEEWATVTPDGTEDFTGYIQSCTRVKIVFDVAKITQSQGATLAALEWSIDGRSGSAADTTQYSDVLTAAGELTLTLTARDSRGRSASESVTVTVMAYAAPRMSNISIFRCNSAGEADEDGYHISAHETAIFSSLSGQNSATITAAYRLANGTWSAETSLTDNAANVLWGTLSPDSSYEVRLTLSDELSAALDNAAQFTQKFPTRKWGLKFRPDGNGAAFGTAAEDDDTLKIPEGWVLKIGNTTLNETQLAQLIALL